MENAKMATQNRTVLWLVLAFIVGALVMLGLLFVRGKSLSSSAHFGGLGPDYGPSLQTQSRNCFDASLNGRQVAQCLGIPGYGQSQPDMAPLQQPDFNY